MRKSILFFLSSMLAISFIACNTSSTDNKPAAKDSTISDNKSVEDYIRSDDSKFEEQIRNGDSVALASHYASDALVMPPNSEEVKGNNIAALWGAVLRMGVKDFKLTITDVTGGGDLYVETGHYEVFGAEKKSLDKGKYVAVWKNENGTWKMYRDIWNSNMTAAPAK